MLADATSASSEELRRAALDHAMRGLVPLPFVLIPMPVLLTLLLRSDIATGREVAWIAAAVVATLLVAASLRRYRVEPADAAPGRRFHVLVAVALAAASTVFGMSTWVVAEAPAKLVVLCTVFPAVAGAVAAIVCAGRSDLFAASTIPLVVASTAGLLLTGDTELVALVVAGVFYAAGLVALHRVMSASLIAGLQVRTRTERLVELLADEQAALTELNRQLFESNAQLEHLASHDALTDLYNRRGTLEALEALLGAEAEEPSALLYLDLDRFKAVNDTLGHRGGDQFLVVLADRIARTIDHRSFAGRIGGDEFVIVLPGHDLARARAVASRLVDVLGQPVHAEGRDVPSSVSIGVAVHPQHGTTTSDLLRNANSALHRAKRAGRDRIELFDGGMQVERDAQVEAEHRLRRALEHGEIVPFFQPEIEATTGRIVGAELLARWLRRDGTLAPAAEFIALAKDSGLLEKLTERVLVQARPHIRRLDSLGLPDGFRFRLNLGPASTDRSWHDDPLAEVVRGIDPAMLTVDVRESAVSADLPAAAAALAAFRARGGRVCLDDFARGVSSLSLLRKLPVDEIRIDRQSIDAVTAHPHDRAIVRSIIAVVRELGMAVTADGVETGPQADALIALGCVRHQGHLYAPALPAESFESFLLERLAAGFVATDTSGWDAPRFG